MARRGRPPKAKVVVDEKTEIESLTTEFGISKEFPLPAGQFKELSEQFQTIAVIYARFSEGSTQTEQSIRGQVRDCLKYAKQNGILVVNMYIDQHISARSIKDRKAFQCMIADAKRYHQFNTVLVWRLDRFSRNRADSSTYKKVLADNGVKVVSVTEKIPDAAHGILMEAILEGYNEYFSAELSEKVLRGIRESALKCKKTGSLPIGYKTGADMRIEIDPDKAPLIPKIFEMYIAGERLSKIAETVNNLGLRTGGGNKLSITSVAKIVQNERYTGVYLYERGGIRIEGGIPAIIDKETFFTAQERTIGQKKGTFCTRNKGAWAKFTYLLSGRIFCGECGRSMYGETIKKRRIKTEDERLYPYYTCHGRRDKTCNLHRISKDLVEGIVIKVIRDTLIDERNLELILRAAMAAENQQSKLDERIELLKKNQAEIELRLKNIMDAIERGLWNDMTATRMKELEAELNAIKKEIRQCKTVNRTAENLKRIQWLITTFTPSEDDESAFWKDMINCFVSSVTVYDDTILVKLNLFDKPPASTEQLTEVEKSVTLNDITGTGQTESPFDATKSLCTILEAPNRKIWGFFGVLKVIDILQTKETNEPTKSKKETLPMKILHLPDARVGGFAPKPPFVGLPPHTLSSFP